MKVGIGYSDNPDSATAGVQAAQMAIGHAERSDPCDLVLLFSTARHDQRILREAVVSVVGESVPIYGGGTVGIITNEYFGYAGDQIAAACLWLDGVRCDVLTEGKLKESEEETGLRLGQRLAEIGTKPDSPVMLFYDAVDTSDGLRLLMATPLLTGIEKGLGFFPDLTGVGMMGDHACTPTSQWIGDKTGCSNAIALAFSGNIRVDNVIMHGCRPATQYYTVTKAAGQVILEINGEPAISFIDKLLNSAISPERYPFFLIFGVNYGDRWGEYNENYYASRLCLGIDKESGGIIMFEPDMVKGTEFQLMFRSLDLDYMKPKIDKMFEELDGREPVFAVYIDCAGRCAGYGGADMEDAVVVQQTVAGRVPVLGLYNGVEIAPIGGRPRGLDWTGVFCLFSRSKDSGGIASRKAASRPVWDLSATRSQSKEVPVEAMVHICEQNAAKILALDTGSSAIRFELEQKRRGFSLLAELTASLRQSAADYESVFIPVTRRINAALNMQRTIVLKKSDRGFFSPVVLQGYSANEKAAFAGRHINLPPELLDPDNPVLVTSEDSEDRFKELREYLGLSYFISSPIILKDEVFAILITGRLIEAHPYLIQLNQGDVETIQAISALLASVLGGQRLAAAEERNRIMVDAIPLCCIFLDENGSLTDCNQEALSLFGLPNKEDLFERFFTLSPEYQPDGSHSFGRTQELINQAFIFGESKFNWVHKTDGGELVPSEITVTRVPKGEGYALVVYIRDLRAEETARLKQNESRELAERYAKAKNEFLASVSHEIRTPLNAIVAMGNIAEGIKGIDDSQQSLIKRGIRSVKLLTSAIETVLDFSKLDSGQMSLEIVEFSVRDLVEYLAGMASGEAGEKSLYLRAHIDSEVPDVLLGDSTRLQQALFNIVMNAVKFTEVGGVEIRVFRGKSVRDGEVSLVFEIQDSGIGISEEHKADLFKPLFVGDAAYTRKHSGMGMGLAVSNGLASLMGGGITCESNLGTGSIFRLFVSLSLPEEKMTVEQKEQKALDTETLRGMRVLVAEDNKINQMVVEELLSSVGIEVTMAENGIEALERLREGSFDVVLLDIQMPEMDGLTAAAQIRSDPRYGALPILAMTANVGDDHLEESLKAGMNDHLAKPVDAEQLYRALCKWGQRK